MKKVFLGIGTNLGNRKNNLEEAVVRIEKEIGPIVKYSSIYETEPWGFQTIDVFLNMVVRVDTGLTPPLLLERILKIETFFGRVRGEKQYVSRVIDIDILLFEDLIIDGETLKITHPLLQERKFVLVPLCEIAPDLVHPVLKKTVVFLLGSCKDKSKVIKYK